MMRVQSFTESSRSVDHDDVFNIVSNATRDVLETDDGDSPAGGAGAGAPAPAPAAGGPPKKFDSQLLGVSHHVLQDDDIEGLDESLRPQDKEEEFDEIDPDQYVPPRELYDLKV